MSSCFAEGDDLLSELLFFESLSEFELLMELLLFESLSDSGLLPVSGVNREPVAFETLGIGEDLLL